MRRRLALSLSFGFLLLLAPGQADASATRLKPRIVHGAATPIVDAPFQVALYDPELVNEKEPDNVLGAQFCGGVIRDATHVLTAAHCITFGGVEAAPPEEIEVLAGSANLEEPEVGAVRDQVVTTSFDPEWDPVTGMHDIGLLTLEKPLWSGATPEIDGSTTKIAPLAFAQTPLPPGSSATVSGWGFDKPLLPGQEPSEAEAAEGRPALLQSAEVSTVLPAECAADYEDETLLLGEFICAIGSGSPTTDACFGDSGGPLFSGAPGKPEDRLLGLVDFGEGCAQSRFPGVYQYVRGSLPFAGSNPPQAPRDLAVPSLSGTLEPGRAVTCEPGSWQGVGLEFRYVFYRDESSAQHLVAAKALTTEFGGPVYTIQDGDVGGRIFCTVEARNAGGFGEAISGDVVIPERPPLVFPVAPPAPLSPVKGAPVPLPPTLRVLSAHCRRGACTVVVRAGNAAGQAAASKIEARLSFVRRVLCRKHGRRARCARTFTRRIGARQLSGGRFSITALDLRPGAYTLTLVAIDAAGRRQVHAENVTLVLEPTRRRR